jgi:hypothetical protein
MKETFHVNRIKEEGLWAAAIYVARKQYPRADFRKDTRIPALAEDFNVSEATIDKQIGCIIEAFPQLDWGKQ